MQGHEWRGEHCLSVDPQLHDTCSLDRTQGIPQLLRTRSLDAAGDDLPQLGALLGRGSYGRVYKGGNVLLTATLTGMASTSVTQMSCAAPHLVCLGHCRCPAVRLLGRAGF